MKEVLVVIVCKRMRVSKTFLAHHEKRYLKINVYIDMDFLEYECGNDTYSTMSKENEIIEDAQTVRRIVELMQWKRSLQYHGSFG